MFSRRAALGAGLNRHAARISELRQAEVDLLDLTLSNPTDPQLGLASSDGSSLGRDTAPYRPDPRGTRAARDAVARYYAELGAVVSADQIVLTASTSEAYSWLFTLLANPGEAVLVPRPSYPLFGALAQLAGVDLWPYREGDVDAVRGGLEGGAVAVIGVHPNNPTGRYIPAREQSEIQDLCRRHGAAVIADEVFFDFPLDGRTVRSHAMSSDALTFTLSGLSKVCGLPGHKLGWILVTGPKARVASALEHLEGIGDTFLSVGTPVQEALPTLLGERHRFQERVRARTRESAGLLAGLLAPIGGGWTGVLPLAPGADDEGVACALLERGIVVYPGYFYDFEEPVLVVSLLTPGAAWSRALPALREALA